MPGLGGHVPAGVLLLFGAQSMRGFAFCMLCGVTVGTYSSIFIASPLLLLWEKREAGDADAATTDPAKGDVPAAAT